MRVLVLALVLPVVPGQTTRPAARVDLTAEFEQKGFSSRRQGARDDCSLFAITALAELESTRGAPGPHARLSPEFLIWAAHDACGKKGDQSMFYEAVAGLNVHGICTEDLMPYEDAADPGRKPSPKAVADAASRRERWQIHWIRRWAKDMSMSDAEFAGIRAALTEGHPVACGLRWPVGQKGYEILAVPPADKVRDGHSIAFVGYEDDPSRNGGGAFVFRNSDGPKWGNHGYGVMSYAYARAYANDALWLHFGAPHSEKPTERFEAESLAVLASSKCEAVPQDMGQFGKLLWSGGAQLFCNAQHGGFADLAFTVRTAGRYRVRVLATAAPDYGTVRVVLDGRRLGEDFDLCAGQVCPAGSLELGTMDVAAGRHSLHFSSIGKRAGSKGYAFGLDAVDLLTP